MNELSDLFRGFVPFGMESYKSVIELIIYLLVSILILGIAILSRVCILLKNQEKQIKETNKESGGITLL